MQLGNLNPVENNSPIGEADLDFSALDKRLKKIEQQQLIIIIALIVIVFLMLNKK